MVVATYAVAFVLAVGARVLAGRARRQPTSISRSAEAEQRHVERIWLAVAATLGLLLINRQFDVLDHFVQSLRRHAYADGWYRAPERVPGRGDRRSHPRRARARRRGRHRHAARRPLPRRGIAATVALVVFVCVRAVSLHDVDHLLGLGGSDVVNGIVEIGLARRDHHRRRRCGVRDERAATSQAPTTVGVTAASVRTTVPRR